MKVGYNVLLVDYFRTSCQYSYCQTETVKCEKFGVRLDPKIKKSTEDVYLRLVHDHPNTFFKKEAWFSMRSEKAHTALFKSKN